MSLLRSRYRPIPQRDPPDAVGQRRTCAVPTVFVHWWWARLRFAHPTDLKPGPSAFHPIKHNRHHRVPIKFDLDDGVFRFFRELKIVELLVDRGFRAYCASKLDAIGRVLPDIK